MPPPTTNLTSHFDASDNDHIWTTWQAGTPFHTGTPAHASTVQVWDDDDGKNISWIVGAGTEPVFNLTSPAMALPSLKFNGSTQFMKAATHDGATNITLGGVFGAAAHVYGVALRIVDASSNASNAYDNNCIVCDSSGFSGVFIKNNAGAYSIHFYAFDGAVRTFNIASVAVNTNYVLLWWHTGGTMFAELYNSGGLAGSGSVACASITTLTGRLYLGVNYQDASFFNGYVGEVVTYNAYVGGDKTNLTSYLQTKWLGGGGGPSAPTLGALVPALAYANASVPVTLTGVAFTGTGLDGASGAFDAVAGFTFSGLSIAAGGASGTVNIQIATAKAAGAYSFTFSTGGGTSTGTSNAQTFTIGSPTGGTSGDTGGNVRFNAGFN